MAKVRRKKQAVAPIHRTRREYKNDDDDNDDDDTDDDEDEDGDDVSISTSTGNADISHRRERRGTPINNNIDMEQRSHLSQESDSTWQNGDRSVRLATTSSTLTDISKGDEELPHEKKKNTLQRGNNAATKSKIVRNQVPLAEVVARRAFECVVDPGGKLSKVLNLTKDAAAKFDRGHPSSDSKTTAGRDEAKAYARRYSHRSRSPSSAYRLEPLINGAAINVGLEVSNESSRQGGRHFEQEISD